MDNLNEFVVTTFKKVKFTRGKKEERIERLDWIKRVFNSNCMDMSLREKADYFFARIGVLFNERSFFKRLSPYEQRVIVFLFYCLDFGDSVQVSDEDFRWLRYVKNRLPDLASFPLAYNILYYCPTIPNRNLAQFDI